MIIVKLAVKIVPFAIFKMVVQNVVTDIILRGKIAKRVLLAVKLAQVQAVARIARINILKAVQVAMLAHNTVQNVLIRQYVKSVMRGGHYQTAANVLNMRAQKKYACLQLKIMKLYQYTDTM